MWYFAWTQINVGHLLPISRHNEDLPSAASSNKSSLFSIYSGYLFQNNPRKSAICNFLNWVEWLQCLGILELVHVSFKLRDLQISRKSPNIQIWDNEGIQVILLEFHHRFSGHLKLIGEVKTMGQVNTQEKGSKGDRPFQMENSLLSKPPISGYFLPVHLLRNIL